MIAKKVTVRILAKSEFADLVIDFKGGCINNSFRICFKINEIFLMIFFLITWTSAKVFILD